MPQPKKYADANARKRAYKERHCEEIAEKKRVLYQNRKKKEYAVDAEKRKKREAVNSKNYRNRKTASTEIVKSSKEQTEAYKCRQTFGKAVTKASLALPRSPRKKCAVLLGLLKKNNLSSPSSVNTTAPWNALSQADKDLVISYYQSEDITWTSPNAREYVRVTGSQEKVPRYYLVCTLHEAYRLFQEKYQTIKIGFAKFCELKPLNVKLNRDLPQLTCLCKYHENFRYIYLTQFDKHFVKKVVSFQSFIDF
jgi:hypothetical protein